MKKVLVFLFLLFFTKSFAQYVTEKPDVENQSEENITLMKVVLRDKFTILNLVYTERGQGGNIVMDGNGIRMVNEPHLISTEQEAYLRAGDKRYKFIKAIGIPISPKDTTIEIGKKIRFAIYFERLDAGETVFDYVEGRNSPKSTRHFWNFYGIHIANPKKNASPEKPSTTLANKIILKGKVLDAKTNLPLIGKLLVFANGKRVDSIVTPKTGDYKMELKPDSYNFTVSSKGYEKTEEELDISSVKGKGQFSKNFSLNVLAESPKTESMDSLSEKPSMLEENKFRLDKVYFRVGDASLLPESFHQLNGLLKMMKENEKMTIQVEGHTDNVGDPELNKRLSFDRAYAVRDYLIQNGIAGERIKFKGYGDTKPISSNDTEQGRQKNRRVEFLILTK